jgi:hypothetical protein
MQNPITFPKAVLQQLVAMQISQSSLVLFYQFSSTQDLNDDDNFSIKEALFRAISNDVNILTS